MSGVRGVHTASPTVRRRSKRMLGLVSAVVLVLGGGAVAVAMSAAGAAAPVGSSVSVERDPAAIATDTGAAAGIQDPVGRTPIASRTDAVATRVEIPAIGVDSTLEQLPLDSAGTLTPPVDFLAAGWYREGTVPGDIGPAVIAGHVDSVSAPAVFARLGELAAGDQIIITLSTGATKKFEVDSLLTTPKDDFPTQRVYGPTPTAQLRVITCDGDFDSTTGHYVDNLVVSASLVS